MKTSHALQPSFIRYIFFLLLVIIGLSMASCGPQRLGCRQVWKTSGYVPKTR